MRNKLPQKLLLFCVIVSLGFLLSFSYQQTKKSPKEQAVNGWEEEYTFRQELIDLEEKNRELAMTLEEKKSDVQELEASFADQESTLFNLVEEVEKLRMFTSSVGIEGSGVEVQLSDASYIPDEQNVNQYLVHESHIHKVVNELKASGAEAIAINGHRLQHDSYIVCTGPVITIDGYQSAAPFVITALGDPDVLESSLQLPNGVVEQLVSDNITVRVERKDTYKMTPYFTKEEA
ncbi:DUF881 domain-containing protein [Aureibacillus halotolerans]|uniref:Uncharacterized protein YlxW (UPF0749 family) n=1 Tax=Aureibacillus halotolerans TaxID=1508390 RepID=A0A4R6UBI1_9BACI|nr:DUF881 domain-containing protein [Aureibacillus halotolerans]TDQ42329.1 uncharacterized protein YlxW (UPF0749 family) [Aureibacillus halotolerans]